MKLEFISFSPDIETMWDNFVAEHKLPLTYSYSALIYLATANNLKNLSFLAVRNGVVALIPILLSDKFTQDEKSINHIKYQLYPYIDLNVHFEDKNVIIEHYLQVIGLNGASKKGISFEIRCWCSIHSGFSAPNLEFKNFELEEGLNLDLLINFCTSDGLILRRNHLRNERRSVQLGDYVSVYHSKTDLLQLELAFQRFVDCFESKTSRKSPADLNRIMFNMLRNGKGYLFESRNRNFSKSFLFCDANGVFARGWRQVNSLNIAKNENPRVLLEKTAIEFFQKKGYCSYLIGEIIQNSDALDSKLASINHFKLGFNPIRMVRTNVQISAADFLTTGFNCSISQQ